MCMNDWEPGVTIVAGSVTDCAWVDTDRSGRLRGVRVPSVGAGRPPTLRCPVLAVEESVVICSEAGGAVSPLPTPGAKTPRGGRRAGVRTTGKILGRFVSVRE